MSTSQVPIQNNTLFYGDNLDILRRYIQSESVDLVYLDPPFNSKADYSILFKERGGGQSSAQIQAFSDFWHWDDAAEKAYQEIQQSSPTVSDAVKAFVSFLGRNDLTAYLVMMAVRLTELHRSLKKTGSLYLHCDPTASHYLKVILDTVFGAKNFRNEIVWKRTFAHGSADKWGDVHDVILFYSKSDDYIWTDPTQPHQEEYLEDKYRFEDARGRFRLVVLTGPGTTGGESGKSWHGYNPTVGGRHWAVPRRAISQLKEEGVEIPDSLHKQLDLLLEKGFIRFPEKKDGSQGVPEYRLYLSAEGAPIQDIIADIPPINSQAEERMGYPTQKPVELLKRLIGASAKEGSWILDPFCGCGTAIYAAHELRMRWIGIDVTHLAISLMKSKLRELGVHTPRNYVIIGEPTTFPEAQELARQDKYQFQWWALSLVDARPVGAPEGSIVGKKGADKGRDGYLTFKEGTDPNLRRIIVQAKGGDNVGATDVRDLIGTVNNSKAAMGLLITLNDPTKPMEEAAREAEYYESPTWGRKYPRIQIITVRELLDKRWPNIPLSNPSN